MRARIKLGKTGDEYVVPPRMERDWLRAQRQDVPRHIPGKADVVETTLEKLSSQGGQGAPSTFRGSAIWAINQQLTSELNKRHRLLGVYIMPEYRVEKDGSGEGINPLTLADERKSQAMRLMIYVGKVAEVKTTASGKRLRAGESKADHPIHRRIREQSPVQPTGSKKGTSVLRRDLIDDYISELNRYPGRRVDAVVGPKSMNPEEGVSLNYLVAETKPWSAYFQIANTGTENTGEWRETFGYINRQLLGRDDTFSINYSTAGFEDSHAVDLSYEAPFFQARRLRYRVYGAWSQYTASDVGLQELNFEGEDYQGGGEMILNVFRRRENFVDLVGGARFQHVQVSNPGAGNNSAAFAVPYVGTRFDRFTDVDTITAGLVLSGWFTGASSEELSGLGRLEADGDAVVLQQNLGYSVFLEPVFQRQKFEEARTTLAHEFVAGVRSQYSFGSRLIPQAEEVAGGLYSVRGYPESIAAGDAAVIGTIEYRFHVPRSQIRFGKKGSEEMPGTKPGHFFQPLFGRDYAYKWRPQQPFGRPDWDLVLRGFVDAGVTFNEDREAFEEDQTLVGAGLGAQLDMLLPPINGTLTFRLDWGIALTDAQESAGTEGVDAGNSRVHFSASLLF